MTDPSQNQIQAPPTLDEILAAGDSWVGRVAFDPPAAPEASETTPPAEEEPGDLPEELVGPAEEVAGALDGSAAPAGPQLTDEVSIEELVSDSLALITRVREARLRHEQALLLEVARRCETIRVQAELDAELTMLLARRRAYALVAAADPRSREAGEIGELDELIQAASRMTGPEPAGPEPVPQDDPGSGP